MGYTVSPLFLATTDEDGFAMFNQLLPFQGAFDAKYDHFAIGDRKIMVWQVQADPGDSFFGKQLRFNLKMFGNNTPSFGAANTGWIVNIPNIGGPVIPMTLKAAGNEPTNQNFEAQCQVIGGSTLFVTVNFYITADTKSFITGQAFNNRYRFLSPILSSGAIATLDNTPDSVYQRALSSLEWTAYVFDPIGSSTNEFAVDTVTQLPYGSMQVSARFYDRNIDATLYDRQLETFTVTAGGSQIAGWTWKGAATGLNNQVDANFDNTSPTGQQELTPFGTNTVAARIVGLNSPVFGTTTDVVVRLIRVDDIQNNTDFIDDYEHMSAVLPQGIVVPSQLDGAISTPSDWSDSSGIYLDVNFDIDGSLIKYGACYRVIILGYDFGNNKVFSHIGPELKATCIPSCYPDMEGVITNVCEDYLGNEVTLAPHERFKLCVTIEKQAYNDCLTIHGLAGDYDSNLQAYAITIQDKATNQFYEFTEPEINDTGATVELCFEGRIPEEAAGHDLEALFYISFYQPIPIGGVQQMQITYNQIIHVRPFENDAATPVITDMQLLDYEEWLNGNLVPIFSFCDREKAIIEVTKDPSIPAAMLIATIYPSLGNFDGDTQNASIEEEESFVPATSLPQLDSIKLEAVEIDFTAGDPNKAYFCINVSELQTGIKYCVDAIIKEEACDYCPVLPDVLPFNGFYVRRNNNFTFVYGYGIQLYNLINSLSIGTPSLVLNDITNAGSNLGAQGLIWGNPSNTNRVYVRIPNSLGWTDVLWRWQYDSVHDGDCGPHTLRHSMEVTIPLPISNQGWVFTQVNDVICVDLDS